MSNKTEVIKIRIDSDIYENIKAIADKADRSYTKQINRALKEWLNGKSK